MGVLIVRQAAVTLEHVLIKDLDPNITDARNHQLAHVIRKLQKTPAGS